MAVEAEAFSRVACLGREELADQQTRYNGSILCQCQWPRPGISEWSARESIVVNYRVDCPEKKGARFVSWNVVIVHPLETCLKRATKIYFLFICVCPLYNMCLLNSESPVSLACISLNFPFPLSYEARGSEMSALFF